MKSNKKDIDNRYSLGRNEQVALKNYGVNCWYEKPVGM